ncbi:hypothetical protein ACI65C_006365 [Semiaphis heraclei]
MPKKSKGETMKNEIPSSSKKTSSKKLKKPAFKFNIHEVLKNRRLEEKRLEQTVKFNQDKIDINEVYQEQVNQNFDVEDNDKPAQEPTHFGSAVFNNYHIPFKNNSDFDLTKLCIQRLQIMSIVGNEVAANIHLNYLKKSNWTPAFDIVQNILCKWPAGFDTQTCSPLSEYQMEDYKNIERHNFELVINFISYSILKNYKNFSVDELLTIAKYTVTIYFHACGQMINVLKRLFSVCIETALEEDNDPAIITFAQELYSEHNEYNILNIMLIDLFLTCEGQIMKKMYTYLTYKLYKSLLGKTDNQNSFPSNIKEWFVQDFVDQNYFKKNPRKVLSTVVRLLEHIVIVFDLYNEEEKLNNMYHFLNSAVQSIGLSDSATLINVLDTWRLQLFRKYVNRQVSCEFVSEDITDKYK